MHDELNIRIWYRSVKITRQYFTYECRYVEILCLHLHNSHCASLSYRHGSYEAIWHIPSLLGSLTIAVGADFWCLDCPALTSSKSYKSSNLVWLWLGLYLLQRPGRCWERDLDTIAEDQRLVPQTKISFPDFPQDAKHPKICTGGQALKACLDASPQKMSATNVTKFAESTLRV